MATSSNIYFYSGQEGINQFCTTCNSITLTANTATSVTVPYMASSSTNVSVNAPTKPAIICVIKVITAAPVFASLNTTPAVTSISWDTQAKELISASTPLIKKVKAGDTIYLITSGSNAVANVVFYLA